MRKIVIVEDEINAQEALKKMLQLMVPHAEILGVFSSIQAAKTFLLHHEIDILFLDVELEDGTGFQLLEQLPNHHFALIFTTAFNQYAIKAFKYSAIDYLLKPIDPNELQGALERARKNTEPIHIAKPNAKAQQIVLHTADKSYVLPVRSIIRLEADGAYTTFYTKDKSILVSKNLKHYEDVLSEHAFIRCHQSHLVATEHIDHFTQQTLTMVNGHKVPVSYRRKHLLKELR